MTVFDVEISAAFGAFVIILISEYVYILIHKMIYLFAGRILTGCPVPESAKGAVISGLGASAYLLQCVIIKSVF